MIDRQAYRQNLTTLTTEQLVQIGVTIWYDMHHNHPVVDAAEQSRLWAEWDDCASELTRRREYSLIEEVFRRVREERGRRRRFETAQEFIARTNREMRDGAPAKQQDTQA